MKRFILFFILLFYCLGICYSQELTVTSVVFDGKYSGGEWLSVWDSLFEKYNLVRLQNDPFTPNEFIEQISNTAWDSVKVKYSNSSYYSGAYTIYLTIGNRRYICLLNKNYGSMYWFWVYGVNISQSDLDDLRRQADEYLGNKNYERAEALYTELLSYIPNDPVLYNNRGLSIWWQVVAMTNNQDKAIDDFNQAIRLNPNFAETYYNRGRAYSNWRSGDDNKAIADLTRAIQLDPNLFEAYYERGFIYHMRYKDFDKAISDYETVLRLSPNHFQANHLLERARQGLAEHGLW